MSSSIAHNSLAAKISNFIRGVVVFVFLISIPAVALYWDHMPFGVKAGFQWVRTQIPHSEVQKDEFSDDKSLLEPVSEYQNERIFPVADHPQELPIKTTASNFPIQQVSHTQPRQPAVALSQNFPQQYSVTEQPTVMQNSEIQDLEHAIQLLGASQCRLEPWGKEGQLYRFSCFAVPASGNHGFQKHFQQIATTPEEAMKKVYLQLQQWQGKRE